MSFYFPILFIIAAFAASGTHGMCDFAKAGECMTAYSKALAKDVTATCRELSIAINCMKPHVKDCKETDLQGATATALKGALKTYVGLVASCGTDGLTCKLPFYHCLNKTVSLSGLQVLHYLVGISAPVLSCQNIDDIMKCFKPNEGRCAGHKETREMFYKPTMDAHSMCGKGSGDDKATPEPSGVSARVASPLNILAASLLLILTHLKN